MKKFFNKFKMRDKGTILRTIFLILALINYILSMVGKKYWGSGNIYEYVSFVIFVVMVIISYWYNNNWTGFASMANDIFNMLSDGKITNEEMISFIEKHKKDCIKIEPEDASKQENNATIKKESKTKNGSVEHK